LFYKEGAHTGDDWLVVDAAFPSLAVVSYKRMNNKTRRRMDGESSATRFEKKRKTPLLRDLQLIVRYRKSLKRITHEKKYSRPGKKQEGTNIQQKEPAVPR